MKNISFFLFCFLIVGNTMLQAQFLPKANTSSSTTQSKTIKNGTILYTMNVQSDEPSAAMLNNSTFEIAFNGQYSKLIGKIMGGVIGGNFILDSGSKTGLALLDMMGQKRAIKMDDSDINKAKSATDGMKTDMIQFVSGTKTIAGHVCKKAIIKNPDKPGSQVIVYVCENIQPESSGLLDNMLKTFKGFPLGFEIKDGANKVTIMATEVSNKIPKKSEFDQAVPKEYELTTMEELENEMGGMIKP